MERVLWRLVPWWRRERNWEQEPPPLRSEVARTFGPVTSEMLWRVCRKWVDACVCVVSIRVYRLIFIKLSANVQRLVCFITVYSNCDGSIKGLSRFVARVGENWPTPPSFSPLAFDNCWEDRNADYCINTADDSSTSDKTFVNFGPLTSAVLWRVCKGWVSARTNR